MFNIVKFEIKNNSGNAIEIKESDFSVFIALKKNFIGRLIRLTSENYSTKV